MRFIGVAHVCDASPWASSRSTVSMDKREQVMYAGSNCVEGEPGMFLGCLSDQIGETHGRDPTDQRMYEITPTYGHSPVE